ncbi:MAG: hypothetical protein U5R31_04335 [Acidimicrobiia bacterium]|nr:hypothetical protein [Acidimicrobiia bacterium]
MRDERPETYTASISFEGAWTGFVTVEGSPESTDVAVQLYLEGD